MGTCNSTSGGDIYYFFNYLTFVDVAKVANIEATTLNLVKLLNSALHVFNESSEHVTKKKKKID
jgi:hypothetical protein